MITKPIRPVRHRPIVERLIAHGALSKRDRLLLRMQSRIKAKPGTKAWQLEKLRRLSHEVERAGWITDNAAEYERLVAAELADTIEAVAAVGRKRRT